jgi:hypothetical protein
MSLSKPRLVAERLTNPEIEAWRKRHVELGDRYEANALDELVALRNAVAQFLYVYPNHPYAPRFRTPAPAPPQRNGE